MHCNRLEPLGVVRKRRIQRDEMAERSVVFEGENVCIYANIDETSAAVESTSSPLLSAADTVFSGRQ
jgi:hypothetical protein